MQLGELIEKMTTSDRLIIISHGHIVATDTPEALSHHILQVNKPIAPGETLWAGYGNVQAHRKDVGLGKHTGTAGADTS